MKTISEVRKQRSTELRGDKTRREILEAAVHIASAEGLEGLTIGRLAAEVRLSKSGLFAHFGSKEELQLAVVAKARDIFVHEVVERAYQRERGLVRLLALLDEWLDYVSRSVFRGGCFFMASAIEFDSRPGKVRDLVEQMSRSWLDAIENEARYAQEIRQLNSRVDAAQLAFELHALGHEANWYYNLFEDNLAFERARSGILARLRQAATPQSRRLLSETRARNKNRKRKG